MQRTTVLLTTVITSLVASTFGAGDTVQTLSGRVSNLEVRVGAVENALSSGGVRPAAATFNAPKHYTIKSGDTITEIAKRNGVSRTDLMRANKLREGQQIYIGDQLVIPGQGSQQVKAPAPPKSAPAPTPAINSGGSGVVHTVRYGDTLHGIARKYGVTLNALKAANGLNSNHIIGGQKIKIPSKGGTNTFAKTDNSKPESQYDNPLLSPKETYGLYTVAKGDNLYALARDFFTSMKELQRLNKLGGSTMIKPGQELVVPTSKYNSYHNKVASR